MFTTNGEVVFFSFRSLKQRCIEDSCVSYLHLPFICNRVKNKKMTG